MSQLCWNPSPAAHPKHHLPPSQEDEIPPGHTETPNTTANSGKIHKSIPQDIILPVQRDLPILSTPRAGCAQHQRFPKSSQSTWHWAWDLPAEHNWNFGNRFIPKKPSASPTEPAPGAKPRCLPAPAPPAPTTPGRRPGESRERDNKILKWRAL